MPDDDSQPLNFRPDYVDANIERRDLLDRKQPRRLGLPALRSILATIPVVRIPDGFWTLDVNEEGYSIAVVACPCGHTPQVEAGLVVVACENCERGYTFTGTEVFVLNPQPRQLAQDVSL